MLILYLGSLHFLPPLKFRSWILTSYRREILKLEEKKSKKSNLTNEFHVKTDPTMSNNKIHTKQFSFAQNFIWMKVARKKKRLMDGSTARFINVQTNLANMTDDKLRFQCKSHATWTAPPPTLKWTVERARKLANCSNNHVWNEWNGNGMKTRKTINLVYLIVVGKLFTCSHAQLNAIRFHVFRHIRILNRTKTKTERNARWNGMVWCGVVPMRC